MKSERSNDNGRRYRPRGYFAWVSAIVAIAMNGAACHGPEVLVVAHDADGDVFAESAAPLGADASDDGDAIDATDSHPVDANLADTTADAAADAPSDALDAAERSCPHAHGGAMVFIDAGIAQFCIDETEVTRGQFNDFLAAKTFAAPAHCDGWRTPPPTADVVSGKEDVPVSNVQWCWAHAYCQWAGKRLCMKLGGTDPGESAASTGGEWSYACANGKLGSRYPYGDAYDATKCVTAPGTSLQKVGAAKECHGIGAPFERVHDLLGNVSETDGYVFFTSSREGPSAPFSIRIHGGSYGDGPRACDQVEEMGFGNAPANVGFRCCDDP
jgi:formylglycine-generating enzyme